MADEGKYSYVTELSAKVFVEGVLVGNGMELDNAKIVASCLVQADMRGVDTQYVNHHLFTSSRIKVKEQI